MAPRRGHARASRDLTPLLALFDVDGTVLLTSDPLACRALSETLEERFAVELPENPVRRVDHAGQSCRRIARLVLHDAGVEDNEIDRGLESWMRRVR